MNSSKENINNHSIGIFDSGIGGLSIWREINHLLPNESTIYLADSINAPYGEKNKEQIIEFSIKNTELLIELGCKIIVVACNTATTNAIEILREKYSIPFIGIEPAIKPATIDSRTGKIGVLATKGTLNSDLFIATSRQFRDTIDFIEVEGKGLVKLIEEGKINETEDLLIKYIEPMLKEGVDNIVLGCSHYPFLIPIIKNIIPEHINIIDSGKAVALQTKNILFQEGECANKNVQNVHHHFYTNHKIDLLMNFLKQIEAKVTSVEFKQF